MDNSKKFFGSSDGQKKVARYYGNMTSNQLQAHMKLVDDAVKCLRETPKRILDSGCGEGLQTLALSLKFRTAAIVGATPFGDELEKARERKESAPYADNGAYKKVVFYKAGMPDFKDVKGGFDLIYSDASFHYVKGEGRPATYARWGELLNDGGVIALRSPAGPTFSDDCCTPSLDGIRAEIEEFNRSAEGFKLGILQSETVQDPFHGVEIDGREKNVQMHEFVIQKA